MPDGGKANIASSSATARSAISTTCAPFVNSPQRGRTLERVFGASFRDGRLWWDTERLQGYGWETEGGIVMLNLVHKTEADLRFTEMIELSGNGQKRARTWQWFRNGEPVRRTLCDEWRVGNAL